MPKDMEFFRIGGMDQLQMKSGEALRLIKDLDQKLWVALSCLTGGLEFDETTLRMVDTNADGRIRCREIIEAVEWTLAMLKDPASLIRGQDGLPLDQINTSSPQGERLVFSAKRILRNLGRPEDEVITLRDTEDREKIFAAVRYNGDGIIPPDAVQDPEDRRTTEDILRTIGGAADRGGEEGVTAAGIAAFFESLKAYHSWWEEDRATESGIRPFGEETAQAFGAMQGVADLIENYFAQCRLAAFDERTEAFLNIPTDRLAALQGGDRGEINTLLEAFPLAKVDAAGVLPLITGVNPLYRDAIATFNRETAARVFGGERESLTWEDWQVVRARFAGYAKWQTDKRGEVVEQLGIERIQECLVTGARERLLELVADDQAIAREIEAIEEVERLVRYHRDLFQLLNNFVAFPDFYDLNRKAIFQAGTLYMDGRSFHLSVLVDDIKRHAAIADQGGIYLLYCEVRNLHTNEKKLIASAVTAGNSNRLAIGKNGVFYDRKGRDWDATVVYILSHPISLREAIWAPFRRLGQMVTSQFEKISASREKALQSSVEKGVTSVDSNIGKGPGALSPSVEKGAETRGGNGMGGMLAGGGVAIAALSSSFAFISSTLSSVDRIYFLYTAVVFLLFILVPSLVAGILKLRKRDISLVLEACGWAINGPMRLNFVLSHFLTGEVLLPVGAHRIEIRGLERRAAGVRWWIWGLFASAVALGVVWWRIGY